MDKLEITFNARIPYDNGVDGRATSIEFTTSSVEEVIRQFNKFLILNDCDARVENTHV
jgi:hypothetical protein